MPINFSTNDAPREPLHGLITWNLDLARTYIIPINIRLYHRHLHQCHDFCKNSIAASRYCTLTHMFSDAGAVIGIGSFSLVTITKLTRLIVPDLIGISFPPNSIRLLVHVLFWFDSHNSSPIPFKLQGVPHRPEYPIYIQP